MKILFIAMTFFVACSNYLVQFPINDWLTFGAFAYPFTFLVTEICNRQYGPKNARRVVYAGFAVAVVLSVFLSTPKIAMASGTAFLVAQLLDISIFTKLRRNSWWVAPFCASALASLVDTVIFWNMAFLGEDLSIATLASGDFLVKIALDLLLLMPYRLSMGAGKEVGLNRRFRPRVKPIWE